MSQNNQHTITLDKEIIEENKNIKNKVFNHKGGPGPQIAYFCSMTSNEGITSIILSFAITLAQCCDYRVLLIDFNYTNSKIFNFFQKVTGFKEKKGDAELYRIRSTGIKNLSIASVKNSVNSADQFASLVKLLAEQKKCFDVILIDGAPIGQVLDLSALENNVDGVIMVIESEKNRTEVLTDIKKNWNLAG